MLIAFTGAQGTGKTTLLNELKKNDKITSQFEFVEGITRKFKAAGYKINQEGDDATQIAMINAHHDNTKLDNAILDRCVLDVFCYTEYLYDNNKITPETFKAVKNVFEDDINKYDVIFYLTPEFDIVADGTRSLDNNFRDDIVHLFEKNIVENDIDVVPLTGSIGDRVNTIYEVLRNKGVDV